MNRYKIIACHVLWRELGYYAALSPNIFDIEYLPQGLHCTPEKLRIELQKAIDRIEPDQYQAILLGYGLCSNGIAGICCRHTNLVVMRGHDCITFLLGSKERYTEYFDKNPGTYWYSPGWIDDSLQPGEERYKETFHQYLETYGEENAEYLMKMEQDWFNKYSNAAYVELPIGDTSRYKKYTRECADWLKWKYDDLAGNPGLLNRFLNGPWNSADFLVVEPGKQIVASNDDLIISTI